MDHETRATSSRTATRARGRRFFLHRQFALLWTGQTLSTFGSYISGAGLPIVAIQLLSGTPLQLGLLAACDSIPVLLISLPAGVWIDHMPRRPLMIGADIGRALLLCCVPLAYALGILQFNLLYLVALLIGTLTIFFAVAQRSLIPSLLQEHELMLGNSRLGMSDALAEIGGPPFASWLIQIITAPLALLFDASSFLLSACCIWRLRVTERASVSATDQSSHTDSEATSGQFWQDLSAGLQILVSHPYLRAIAAYTGLFTFCGGSFAALYMLYLLRTLHLPLIGYGAVVMMGGLGNLLGVMLAGKIARRYGLGKTLIGSTILFGVMALTTPLATGPTWVVVGILMAGQLIGDTALTVYMIHALSWRQTALPAQFQGRINACMHLLEEGIGPIGAISAAIFCQLTNNIRLTLLLGALGMLLAAICLFISPFWCLPSSTKSFVRYHLQMSAK
jgi:MFS family permease